MLLLRLVYLMLCRSFRLLSLLARGDAAKDLEILVLRHQLAECLDWLLVTGRRHVEQVLRGYVDHYDVHRPHRALGLEPPNPPAGPTAVSKDQGRVHGRDRLEGCSASTTGELHERVSAPYGELSRYRPPAG